VAVLRDQVAASATSGKPQPRPITASLERPCVQWVAIAGRHRETVSPSRGLARQPAQPPT